MTHNIDTKKPSGNMPIRKFEIERLTVTSSKPFEAVVAALKAQSGIRISSSS